MRPESDVMRQVEYCLMHSGFAVLPRKVYKSNRISYSIWSCYAKRDYKGIIWRVNTGSMKKENRYIQFGIPGDADFSGWVFRTGQRIEIEVKSPRGALSIDQKARMDLCAKTGVLCGVARSYTDCERLIKDWGLKDVPVRLTI